MEKHTRTLSRLYIERNFLGEQREIDWFINGMGNFFPEAKQRFLSILSEEEQKNPLFSYLERLQHTDPVVQSEAARAWSVYEQSCSTLRPADSSSFNFSDDDDQLSFARLEAHYFVNKNFLSENEIIKNLACIQNKPQRLFRVDTMLCVQLYPRIC